MRSGYRRLRGPRRAQSLSARPHAPLPHTPPHPHAAPLVRLELAGAVLVTRPAHPCRGPVLPAQVPAGRGGVLDVGGRGGPAREPFPDGVVGALGLVVDVAAIDVALLPGPVALDR